MPEMIITLVVPATETAPTHTMIYRVELDTMTDADAIIGLIHEYNGCVNMEQLKA